MKKICAVIIASVMICLVFAGCYMDGRGTYYPDKTEMTENLTKKGYTVTTDTIKKEDEEIVVIKAEKGDEFIDFYRFGTDKYVYECMEKMKEDHSKYDHLCSVTNSKDHGNLAYCSTKKARDNSGIQVIEVDTD